jgi:hypothetical protein
VSDREIILNRGSEHGVHEGMYFAVLNPDTIGVTDPQTGEELGGIKIVKRVVRAVEVAPKLTLARTFRTRTVNAGGANSALSAMASAFATPNYVEQVEKLTIDRNSPRKIDPSQSIVGRGDPFELAFSDEVEDIRSVTVWEEK